MVARLFWSSALVVSCAAITATAAPHPLQGPDRGYSSRVKLLATRPAYPANVVDDVRRPGANGKPFITRGWIGDPEGKYPRQYPVSSWGDPGPAGYGTFDDDYSEVLVRVGETAVVINPWESIPEAGYQHLERGRIEWLKENGYAGGVRTFTNPLYRRDPAPDAVTAKADSKKLPDPRAVFELPADMPRFKKRQEVNSAPKSRETDKNHAHTPHTIVVVRTKDEPAIKPTLDDKAKHQIVAKPTTAQPATVEPAPKQLADATKR
ncbi:MAG: hypothetical protein IT435_12405 [Phycisphaerales bacterium]|nr:hypothetical protein [Phycisphaerales bacterium]